MRPPLVVTRAKWIPPMRNLQGRDFLRRTGFLVSREAVVSFFGIRVPQFMMSWRVTL